MSDWFGFRDVLIPIAIDDRVLLLCKTVCLPCGSIFSIVARKRLSKKKFH